MSDPARWSLPDVLDILGEQTPGTFNEAFRCAVAGVLVDGAHHQATTWMIPCKTQWQATVLERVAKMTGLEFVPVTP